MHDRNSSPNSRILLGIILILIGGLYLLETLDFISMNIPHIIFSFPFILFIVGIIILFNSRNKVFGALLTFIGALTLVPRIFPEIHFDSDIIWPVILIAIGLMIIFKRRSFHECHRSFGSQKVDKDFIEDVAVFGGGHKVIRSENFRGGNITAIFGGSEIDLTQCKLAEGENVIDVMLLFGGTTIILPRDWDVRLNVTPIFGGFSHKRTDPNAVYDSTRTLVIKGVAIFGGGDIKSYF